MTILDAATMGMSPRVTMGEMIKIKYRLLRKEEHAIASRNCGLPERNVRGLKYQKKKKRGIRKYLYVTG